MTYLKKNQKNGYTILELLFYVAIFAVLSLIVINAFLVMTKAFRETSLQIELSTALNIMERISRDTRSAYSINAISSNSLTLNTKDDAGLNKTVQFLLSGSNVQFLENGVLVGNLNTANILVTSLTFSQITTAKATAVKIFLGAKSSKDPMNRIENFYDTVTLRGDY